MSNSCAPPVSCMSPAVCVQHWPAAAPPPARRFAACTLYFSPPVDAPACAGRPDPPASAYTSRPEPPDDWRGPWSAWREQASKNAIRCISIQYISSKTAKKKMVENVCYFNSRATHYIIKWCDTEMRHANKPLTNYSISDTVTNHSTR